MSVKPTGRPSLLKPRAYARWWLVTVRQSWQDGWADVAVAKANHQRTKTIVRQAKTELKATTDLDEQVRIMARATAAMHAKAR